MGCGPCCVPGCGGGTCGGCAAITRRMGPTHLALVGGAGLWRPAAALHLGNVTKDRHSWRGVADALHPAQAAGSGCRRWQAPSNMYTNTTGHAHMISASLRCTRTQQLLPSQFAQHTLQRLPTPSGSRWHELANVGAAHSHRHSHRHATEHPHLQQPTCLTPPCADPDRAGGSDQTPHNPSRTNHQEPPACRTTTQTQCQLLDDTTIRNTHDGTA